MNPSVSITAFTRHLLEGNVPGMELCLGNMVSETFNAEDLGKETSYLAFMAGLLMSAAGRYRTVSDHESGDGYHDILMECMYGGTPHVVIEVKKVMEGQDADKVAERALTQILDRGYYRDLNGPVLLYGIAFDGKIPVIALERIDCP